MRTVLICHHDAPLHREGIAAWLASFTDLAGVLVVREPSSVLRRRFRREVKRVGPARMIDVVAFRAFYRLGPGPADAAWLRGEQARLRKAYPPPRSDLPVLEVGSPNSAEAQAFIERLAPDMMLALSKSILAKRIFSIPRLGTWVLHPGICPEYRNAHGCFWALAMRDLDRVGLTLLRIDEGVDTGPIYRYFTYAYDEVGESHIVIQTRVMTENLDAIGKTLLEIAAGEAAPLSTAGRTSGTWGQPWLTRYVRWKTLARRRARARAGAALP